MFLDGYSVNLESFHALIPPGEVSLGAFSFWNGKERCPHHLVQVCWLTSLFLCVTLASCNNSK